MIKRVFNNLIIMIATIIARLVIPDSDINWDWEEQDGEIHESS